MAGKCTWKEEDPAHKGGYQRMVFYLHFYVLTAVSCFFSIDEDITIKSCININQMTGRPLNENVSQINVSYGKRKKKMYMCLLGLY